MFDQQFVDGINAFLCDKLQVSRASLNLWSGKMTMENIDLNNVELMESSGMPMMVKFGKINKMIVEVPWSDLYEKPTTVLLEGVYMFIVPQPDKPFDEEYIKLQQWKMKTAALAALESKLKRAADKATSEKSGGEKSYAEKLILTVVRNLEIRVENIHIRYEDDELYPGSISTFGCMLKTFLLKTTSEQWSGVAVPENMPTIIKTIEMEGTSFYVNCDSNSYDSQDLYETISLLKRDLSKADSPHFMYVMYPVSAIGEFKMATKLKKSASSGSQSTDKAKKAKGKDAAWMQFDIEMGRVAFTTRKYQYHLVMEIFAMLLRKWRRATHLHERPGLPIRENLAAWWKFAYTCVLNDIVRRRRRMWSWEHMRRHRDICNQYRLKYFERLAQGMTTQIQEELEEHEKVLDIYNIVLLRRQAETKWEKLRLQRGETFFVYNWIRWIISWFRSSKTEAYDNVFTSEEKKKFYEKLQAEYKIMDQLMPEYYSFEMKWKVKSFDFRLLNSDPSAFDVVAPDAKEGSTVTVQRKDKVLKMQLDEMLFDLTYQPSSWSYRYLVEFKALYVLGLATDSNADRPVIARSHNSSEEESWFYYMTAYNPVITTVNKEIILRMLPLTALMDMNTYRAFLKFFEPPQQLHLQQTQDIAKSKLDELKKNTRWTLKHSIQSHMITNLLINIHPVTAVIPSSSDIKTCARMVVLVGPLEITTVSHHKLIGIVETLQGLQEVPLQTLKEQAYDEFVITVSNFQLLYAAEGEDWLKYEQVMDSPVHILKPLSAQLRIHNCVIQEVDLPQVRMNGSVPVLNVSVSNQRLAAVQGMMLSLSGDLAAPPPEEDLAEFRTITKRMTIAVDDPDKLIQALQDPIPPKKPEKTVLDLYILQSSFTVDEICVNFSEAKDNGEIPAVKMTIQNMGANYSQHTNAMVFDAFVGAFQLQHMQFKVNEEVSSWFQQNRIRGGVLGSPIDLVDTVHEEADIKSRLLAVDIKLLLKGAKPDLMSRLVAATVNVQLEGLDVLLHKEAIVHALLLLSRCGPTAAAQDGFSSDTGKRRSTLRSRQKDAKEENKGKRKSEEKKGAMRDMEKDVEKKVEENKEDRTEKSKEKKKNSVMGENKEEKKDSMMGKKKEEKKDSVMGKKKEEKKDSVMGKKKEEKKANKTDEKKEEKGKKTEKKIEDRTGRNIGNMFGVQTVKKMEKIGKQNTDGKEEKKKEKRKEKKGRMTIVKKIFKRKEVKKVEEAEIKIEKKTVKKEEVTKRRVPNGQSYSSLGKVSASLVLSKLSLAVCSNRLLVTDIMLSQMQSDVLTDSDSFEFSVFVENLIVYNCLPTFYPKAVSCEDGQMLRLKLMAKKNAVAAPAAASAASAAVETPSYRFSVDLNCGSVQIVVLMKFIARLMELVSYVPQHQSVEPAAAEVSATESIYVRLSSISDQIATSISDETIRKLLSIMGEFDVTLQCPIIILPASDVSTNVFVISLGLLNLRSKDSRNLPKHLDDTSFSLSAFAISRMVIQNSSASMETPILEPVTFEVKVFRSLDPLSHPELPVVNISCRISLISLLFDASDCQMAMRILEQYYKEFEPVETLVQTGSESRPMTATDVAQPEESALPGEVTTQEGLDESQVVIITTTMSTPLTGYDLISLLRFSLEIEGFELDLNSGSFDPASSKWNPLSRVCERNPEKSILKLQMNGLNTNMDVKCTGAFIFTQTMHQFVLRDVRPKSEEGATRSSSDLQNFITMTFIGNPRQNTDSKTILTSAVKIQQHRSYLENAISPHQSFLTKLLNTKVLLESDFQAVTSCADNYERNRKLLDIVSKKDEAAFKDFLVALNENHQKHVVELLESAQVDTNGFYVAINYFYVAISMDFIKAIMAIIPQLLRVNTQKYPTRAQATKSVAAIQQVVEYEDENGVKIERKVRSVRLFDVFYTMNDVEFVLLEDARNVNTLALITKVQFDTWMSAILEEEREKLVFFSSVKFKSLLAAFYSNVDSKCEIVGAVEVELDSKIPQISFSDDIVISLSPVSVNMMMTVLNTFIVPTLPTQESEVVPGDLWSARKITDFNFLFLRRNSGLQGIIMKPRASNQEELSEDGSETEEVEAKHGFQMSLDRLCIVLRLVDKRSKLSVMSQLLMAKFQCSTTEGKMKLSCRFALESYFYNVKSVVWEPVVDVIEGEEPGTYKSWEMIVEVDQQDKPPSSDGNQAPMGGYKINCEAHGMLKLTVTDAMLQSVENLKESLRLGSNVSDIITISMDRAAPYRLINDCGKDITVRLDRTYMFSEEVKNPAVLAPGQSLDFYDSYYTGVYVLAEKMLRSEDDDTDETDAEDVPNRQVHLVFEEYDAQRSFQLAGNKWAFVLKKEELLRNTWELVTEIEGYFGQIMITFRSTVQVFNDLQFPVEVYYEHVRGGPLLIGQMLPNASMTLPYAAVYTPPHKLFFKPIGDQYKVSTEFEWKSEGMRDLSDILECKSTSKEISSIFIKAKVHIENICYELTDETTVKTLKLHLHPPLVFKNLLPLDIDSELITKVKEVAVKIEPGHDVHLYKANPTGTKLKATFFYDGRKWIGRCLITNDINKFMIWNFKANRKEKMGLGLHCFRSNGYLEIDLFCPYWMINLTESDLFYKAGMSSVVPHKTDFKGAVLFPYSVSLFGMYLNKGCNCIGCSQKCNCFGSAQKGAVEKSPSALEQLELEADRDNQVKKPTDNSDPEQKISDKKIHVEKSPGSLDQLKHETDGDNQVRKPTDNSDPEQKSSNNNVPVGESPGTSEQLKHEAEGDKKVKKPTDTSDPEQKISDKKVAVEKSSGAAEHLEHVSDGDKKAKKPTDKGDRKQKSRDKKVAVEKSAGAAEQLEHEADHSYKFRRPIDNSDPEQQSSVKINVKLMNSGWSDEFCIDVIGTVEQVVCKIRWKSHYLSVNVALSSTGLTRIITFKPFYTVANQANFTIAFRENASNSIWIMAEHNHCYPFWPRHAKEMVAAIPNSQDSSTMSIVTLPFPITKAARTLLKIDHPLGAINVHCNVSSSGVQIIFQPYTNGTATALLVNHTVSATILFTQVDVSNDRRSLLPGDAVLYTWQDPTKKRQLVWSCADSESYKNELDRDGIGAIEVESQGEMRWLSFLDGKQRVFMVTDNQLVVDGIMEAVTEKLDMDVAIRMAGVSVTLVSTRFKQPITCFTVDGYSVVWKLETKGDFSVIDSMRTVDTLEDGYLEYLRELKVNKDSNPRRMLKGKVNVDFARMMMYRPDKGLLKRGIEWGLKLKLQLSSQYALLHFKLKQFEVVNLLPGCVYESVASPVTVHLYGAQQKHPPKFMELSIVAKNSAYSNIVQLKYFELLIQPFELNVELTLFLSLLTMMMPQLAKDTQLKNFQEDCMRINGTLRDDVFSANVEGFLLYCDLLRISPLEIHLSFSWLITRTEREEKRFSRQIFLESVGAMMSDINDVELRLGFFERKFAFCTPAQLCSDAQNHYTQQGLKQIYLFAFGWDILGNPFAVLRDVEHGLEDLFYHPYYGSIESPAAFFYGLSSGTSSMASHTLSGFAGAGSRITKALGKAIVTAASDQTYKRKRRELLSRHPSSFPDGLKRGGQRLVLGLKHGLTGVVTQPYHGAKKGVLAFCKGVGAGIVGIVVIPITGVFDFVSVTFEGLRKSSRNLC